MAGSPITTADAEAALEAIKTRRDSAGAAPAEQAPDPLVHKIRLALRRANDLADSHRDRRTQFAVRVALLAPISVALLAAQVLWIDHGFWAKACIAGELLLLAYALATGFMNMGEGHKPWIEARLRAELLRREEFLLRARVGPYGNCEDPEACVEERLHMLAGEGIDPVELIELEEPDGRTWRDLLEEGGAQDLPPETDILRVYLEQRVRDQKDHYAAERSERHERQDVRYENAARATLVAALILAGIHLGLLFSPDHESPFGTAIVFFALVLPPLGAMFMALRANFQNNRLHLSFTDQAGQLARVETMLVDLESHADTLSPEDRNRRFKRLVLRAEAVIASELRRWWLIVSPERPVGGA